MGAIWSVAPKSIVQEFAYILYEAFMQKGNEDLLEKAKEQAPKGFLRDNIFNLSKFSLVNAHVKDFFSVLGCSIMCTFRPLLPPWLPPTHGWW